jgi:hypothetical protein
MTNYIAESIFIQGGNMIFFKRKKEKTECAVQTASAQKSVNPFKEIFSRSKEIILTERKIYKTIREAVPIIDVAISKLVKLMGGFKISHSNEALCHEINQFLREVKVGVCGIGIESFMQIYMNQLLTYGTAIGEIVLNEEGNKIAALYNSPLENIILKQESNNLKLKIMRSSGKTEIKYPELILISALNPEPGEIYGNSLLKGLPFMSEILLKIFTAIGINWERVGNTRFAITYNPGGDSDAFTKERAEQIAREWSIAMKNSVPTDFIAIGDIKIKAIGADNQILDSKVPVRQILEQIVSKFSIPPFLLGLSWSTTETMSTQQADLLTNELESYRRILNPIIFKICKIWFELKGFETDFEINWEYISLKDKLRDANAKFIETRTKELEMKMERYF